MNPYERRELFDRIEKHLLTQNARAEIVDLETGGSKCRYRTGGGRSCAIGCIITDENYDVGLEGSVVGDSRLNKAVCDSLGLDYLRAAESNILNDLQMIHDATPVSNWQFALNATRQKYEQSGLIARK